MNTSSAGQYEEFFFAFYSLTASLLDEVLECEMFEFWISS